MIKSRLLATLFVFMGFMPLYGHTAIVSIGEMAITGGTFGFDQTGGEVILPFQTIGTNTNLVDGYIGTGGADPDGILGMQYSGSLLSIYTAATNLGDVNSVAGSLNGGPVASGTLDTMTGTITMDLSSWFANWSGNDISMGTGKDDGITSAFATGTWDSITGEYSLSWQSLDTGPYLITSLWTLEGTASPVPLPSALWLFGSGLIGLVGFSRRKKA